MVLMEFSITPLGEGESVGEYVARCVDIIDKSGLDYQLHAMGTNVEGELDQVLDLLKRCTEEVAKMANRVSVTAKFDYREGHSGMLREKVASVEKLLGRRLKTEPG